MTIRWVLFGELEQPVGLLRFDSVSAQWWNLELVDDQDERGERGYWSMRWVDEDDRPAARDQWRPGWVQASPTDVGQGDQAVRPGAHVGSGSDNTPDTYMGRRGVDVQQIRAELVRSVLRGLAVPEELVEAVPATPGRPSRAWKPQVPLKHGHGPSSGV
jgi:hypothetical protein